MQCAEQCLHRGRRLGAVETFKTFKANPVPMPFAELYGALESKAVDGQENPYAVVLSNKLYEVNKYVSETNPKDAGM